MSTFGMAVVTIAAIVVGAAVALLPRGRTDRALKTIAMLVVGYYAAATAWGLWL
jgi:ABC-type dipeptide/oligopeptide/nickel transport system permease component